MDDAGGSKPNGRPEIRIRMGPRVRKGDVVGASGVAPLYLACSRFRELACRKACLPSACLPKGSLAAGSLAAGSLAVWLVEEVAAYASTCFPFHSLTALSNTSPAMGRPMK
jgi:hypothetical protein